MRHTDSSTATYSKSGCEGIERRRTRCSHSLRTRYKHGGTTNNGKMSKTLTLAEVAAHDREDDCYLIIGNERTGGAKVSSKKLVRQMAKGFDKKKAKRVKSIVKSFQKNLIEVQKLEDAIAAVKAQIS